MSIQRKLAADVEEAEKQLTQPQDLNTEEANVIEPTQNVEQETELPPVEDAEETAQEEHIDWEAESKRNEQRYKVMQGKYNAELPRYKDEIKQLKETIAESNRQQEAVYEPVIEDDDDFPELSERINPLEERLKRVEEHDAQQQQANDQQIMFSELDALSPGWQQVNEDQAFLNWLAEPDPMTGNQRQDLLNVAVGNREASQVAAIIQSWQDIQPRKANTNSDLERRVTPSNKAGSQPQGKNTYTQADVIAHFDRMNKLISKGQMTKSIEEKAAQFERELFVAEKEGRIIP